MHRVANLSQFKNIRNDVIKMQNDAISNDANNVVRMLNANRETMINRRKSILIDHFRNFIANTYASHETNIYVESIDEYLFHVVIDMKLSITTNRRAIDSFVIRFRSYSHDEFDELSKIYA